MTIPKQQLQKVPETRMCCLTACILCLTTACIAVAERQENYELIKREELAQFSGELTRLRTLHEKDGALESFFRRLELVDEVTQLLIESFEASRSDSLNSVLGDIAEMSDIALPVLPSKKIMRASGILSEYSDIFREALLLSSLAKEEADFLRNYYDTAARLAGKYLARRGQMVSAINKQSGVDVLELCLVMPFLHLSDQQWTTEDIESLPKWMKTDDNIAALERFALRVRRPFTAYQFSLFNRKSDIKGREFTYPDYLLSAAESRIKHRDYHVAIYCIRIGIEQAEQVKKEDTATELRFSLSDLLSNIGHSGLAAKEILELMESYPQCPDWGKAAMLRIKYLYEAADFKAIAAEANEYQSDSRCSNRLAQILYMSWVTHRRLNDLETAQKIEQQFLKQYSKHPLGADMYFASAMTAMASGNYEEAGRLLEIVEYQYPKSRIQQKVKKIRQRLEKSAAGKLNG